MICKGCNEEYNETMFTRCPYCLCDNIGVDSVKECICENVIDAVEEGIGEDMAVDVKENIDEDMADSVEESIDEDITDTFINSIDNNLVEDVMVINMPMSNRCKNVLRRNGLFKLSQIELFLKNNDLSSFYHLGKGGETEILEAIKSVKKRPPQIDIIDTKPVCKEERSNVRLRIEDVFNENKYNIFVQYCNDNKMVFFDELEKFNFANLISVRGMGTNKINCVIQKYKDISGNYEVVSFDKYTEFNDNSCTFEVKRIFESICPELHKINIFVLRVFGVSPTAMRKLYNIGYTTLGQLENMSENELEYIVGKLTVEKLRNIEDKLQLTIIDLLGYIFEISKCKDEYTFVLKRSLGYTLQEIADENGLTKERIRQIVNKFYDRISPLLDGIVLKIHEIKGYITVAELLDIFDNDEYDKIIIEMCRMNPKLEFLDFANVFVIANSNGIQTEKCLLDIATEFVGTGIDLYENIEELETLMHENGFEYIGCGEFMNLLQKYGYKLYGDFAIKGRQSYGLLCARIVAKEFPNGIKIYGGDDLQKLRELAKKQYGDLNIPDEDRAFSARLSDFLVISGRGMVTAKENIEIDISVIEQIKEYIDEIEETDVYYTELFTRFEGILRMTSNVDNYNFLHGVLMMYYPEDYTYSRDCIIKKNKREMSGRFVDRIKKLIVNKNRPVHRNEIATVFPGATDAMLFRAIYTSEELFVWDYKLFSSASLLSISSEEKSYIKDIIDDIMEQNQGYCSDMQLYCAILDDLKNCLEKNGIKSATNLYYVCSYLFSNDYDFRRPHIGKKGTIDMMSLKDVALHLLGNTDEIRYNDFSDIAKRMKWSSTTMYQVFSTIEKDYIRLSDDRYIKKELFVINENTMSQIEEILLEKMKYDVLPITNFEEWELLPDIGYDWNHSLLNSIVDKVSNILRIIEPRISDRRFERGIIVYNDSDFVDYADIVVHYMKQNEYVALSEADMLSFVVLNGLAHRSIPKELYNGEKIKFKDDKFIIS